jgi:hypothetical protein
MMKLKSVTLCSLDDLNVQVKEIKPIRLFYVTTGRNAWRETWINRYSEGCMHTSLESAQSYCERKRVQGTVFYISHMPTIAFISDKRMLAVTEINTQNILGNLNFEKLTTLTSILPFHTMTLHQISLIFRPASPLLPTGARPKVIRTFSEDVCEILDCSANDRLIAQSSHAVGIDRFLKWSDRDLKLNFSNVLTIASILNERLMPSRHVRQQSFSGIPQEKC